MRFQKAEIGGGECEHVDKTEKNWKKSALFMVELKVFDGIGDFEPSFLFFLTVLENFSDFYLAVAKSLHSCFLNN